MPSSLERHRLGREDRRLVRRMIGGDEQAFEAFANAYIPLLYRFAMRRLEGRRDLARDIVQDTLCKAIAKLPTFRGEAALSTWLCAVCRNEIAGHFRRRYRAGREVEVTGEEIDAEAAVETPAAAPQAGLLRRETRDLVHIALDTLPPHYGRILEWKYLEELPVKEIAGRLDMSPKAAESLLTRARVAFKSVYEELRGSGAEAPAETRHTSLVTS